MRISAKFARFVGHPRTYVLVFEPVLSDMQLQVREAVDAGEEWKARIEQLRGYWIFWETFVLQAPVSLSRLIFNLWQRR